MIFLLKKMVRSIKQFKLQFISVFLLATLSVVVYSGLEGVWSGMKNEFDSYVDDTNLADEWIFATYFTDDDITKIMDLEGVKDISKRMRITAASTDKNGNDSYLSLDTIGNANITSMYIMEGNDNNDNHKNSVWIDYDYAKKNDISVGDKIALNYGGKYAEPEVVGIIMSSERAHYTGTTDYYSPDHQRFGYGFFSEDILSQFDIKINCNLLEIKSDKSSVVKEKINELMGERFIAYYDKESLFDVAFVSNQVKNLRRISILFSSLFILLSILSMHTTIKRLIDAQSSDIATLKSLGFSNKSLIIHYSMYGLFVSIIGTAVGFICSFPFSKVVQKTQQTLISMPEWPIKHTVGSPIIIFMLIFLSTLTSILAAKKTMVGLPAEFTQKKVKHNKKLLLEKIPAIWNKLSFGMKWTLRDASAHKTRIFLGIVSVCGSFMLLMVGFGTPDSITSLTDRTYNDEFIYSNKLTLNTANTPEDMVAVGEEYNGQFVQTLQSRVYFNDSDKPYFKPVTIFSDGGYINLKTVDGDKLDDNGAFITEGMAEKIKVEKGDTIELYPSFSAQSYKFKVAGIIPSSMPQSLYIKDTCWMSNGAMFRPSHLFTGEIDDDKVKNDSRITQIITSNQQKNNLKDFRSAMIGVFTLMRFVAFVLVVIVLYNLSTLSFLERTKEYNTFRVLGFHYKEIRSLASFENVIILIIGSVFGLPLGFKFLDLYCDTFSNDTLKIYSNISNISIILVCFIVVFCTIVTTLLLSLRIRKIDMVQALKDR